MFSENFFMLRIEEHQFGVLRDLQKIRDQSSWRTNFTLKIEEHLFGVQQDLQKIREQCSWRTHFILKIKEPSQLIDTRFTEPTYSDPKRQNGISSIPTSDRAKNLRDPLSQNHA